MDTLAASPRKGYRLCVGIALFAADGQVFLGKRASRGVVPSYSWQMPQGGIDPGEEALDAAHRELYEETSITSTELIGEVEGWLHYDLPKDVAVVAGTLQGAGAAVVRVPLRRRRERDQRHRAARRAQRRVLALEVGAPGARCRRWWCRSSAPVYEHVVKAFAPLAASQDLRPEQRQAI